MSDEMCYGGRCPKCGNLCAVVVDDVKHKKYTIKAVKEFMEEGLEIERVTVEAVRTTFKSCSCKSVKESDGQGNLFEANP